MITLNAVLDTAFQGKPEAREAYTRARELISFARGVGASLDGRNLHAVAGAFIAAGISEHAEAFHALACPRCGSSLARYSGKTNDFRCVEGHSTYPEDQVPARPAFPRALLFKGVGEVTVKGAIDERAAARLRSELAGLRAEAGRFRALLVAIDSHGGAVAAALEMHDMLQGAGVPVVTHVVGDALSAATLIALAGTHIVAGPGARLMYHRAHGAGPDANRAASAQVLAVYLRTVPSADADTLVSHYQNAGDVWLTPAAALGGGWCDAIGSDSDALNAARAVANGGDLPFSSRRAALGLRS